MFNTKGFSLIELVVAMLIFSLLAAIAYPNYVHYITRARRSEGQAALLNCTNHMERYFIVHHRYQGATMTNLSPTSNGWYHLEVTVDKNDYVCSAIPQKAQAKNDKGCGVLTLDQHGQQGIKGNEDVQHCWLG